MSQAIKGLFGGGQGDARRAAEQSRQAQAVANDRQLSALNRQDKASAVSRRAPRGRRLFEDGPDMAATVLGNG